MLCSTPHRRRICAGDLLYSFASWTTRGSASSCHVSMPRQHATSACHTSKTRGRSPPHTLAMRMLPLVSCDSHNTSAEQHSPTRDAPQTVPTPKAGIMKQARQNWRGGWLPSFCCFHLVHHGRHLADRQQLLQVPLCEVTHTHRPTFACNQSSPKQ